MVRKPRQTSPTKYYHVMMRGNNRESVFQKYEQKHYFAELLKNTEMDSPLEIASYCIMNNHVHILAYGEIEDLSEAFKKINIQYAMVYNIKNERVGHVFQDRFRSETVRDDTYFLQVIRYIHNNPVTAKIIEKPEEYIWTSYREFLARRPTVVSPNQMDFINGLFAHNLEHFKEFHFNRDYNEYLDTDEDIEQNRSEIIRAIFKDISSSSENKEISSLLNSEEAKKEAVRKLLKETSLSHRRIASLIGVNSSMVHRISLDKNND